MRRVTKVVGLTIAILAILAAVASSAGADPYVIQNGANGKCLDADTRTIGADATKVQLWQCNGSLQQLWYVDTNSAQTGGTVRSALSGRCLDADTRTIGSNGTTVQLWDCNRSSQQLWYGQGNAVINALRLQALDADTRTLSTDGTVVQLWQPNQQPQQQWFLKRVTGTINSSSTAVTVRPGRAHTSTISWSAPTADAQVWESVDGGPTRLFASGAAGSQTATIPEGNVVFTLARGVDPFEALASVGVTGVAPYPAGCGLRPTGPASQITASLRASAHGHATSLTTRLSQRVIITGTLKAGDGAPVAGAPVCVVARADQPGASQSVYAIVSTDATGRFSYALPAGPSRSIWLVGDGSSGAISSQVQVRVRARVSLGPAAPRVRNHETLVLRGRVPAPIPPGGVLVVAQVWRGSFWQPFAFVHSRPDGSFSTKWHFTNTPSTTDYRMRVVAAEQASYPYATGRSRTVVVHVTG
ncbi:MAG: ricin-type beta-trefoil lectin domain protein [Solirubrobacteraceae bacterium]